MFPKSLSLSSGKFIGQEREVGFAINKIGWKGVLLSREHDFLANYSLLGVCGLKWEWTATDMAEISKEVREGIDGGKKM